MESRVSRHGAEDGIKKFAVYLGISEKEADGLSRILNQEELAQVAADPSFWLTPGDDGRSRLAKRIGGYISAATDYQWVMPIYSKLFTNDASVEKILKLQGQILEREKERRAFQNVIRVADAKLDSDEFSPKQATEEIRKAEADLARLNREVADLRTQLADMSEEEPD